MLMFNPKFFYAEPKFSLLELVQTLMPRNDLDVCLKRFCNKAPDCCDLVEERRLIKICLHDTLGEYRILLENLSFSFFLS